MIFYNPSLVKYRRKPVVQKEDETDLLTVAKELYKSLKDQKQIKGNSKDSKDSKEPEDMKDEKDNAE